MCCIGDYGHGELAIVIEDDGHDELANCIEDDDDYDPEDD